MKNHSHQRETILAILRSTTVHPTAEWIYREARKQIPNISLGTVYRNLADLNDAGLIAGIHVGDGKEHYDGDISGHIHLHCKECGVVLDAPLYHNLYEGLEQDCGFQAESVLCVVEGYCEHCKNI